MMGSASAALLPDGQRITRKTVERKSYTVAESSYTDFRILKASKKARAS